MGLSCSNAQPVVHDAPVVDESELYKANYDPSRDDRGGLPLSGLISCPFVASMYNAHLFKSIADEVAQQST